jgi:hypothetical protein
MTNSPDTTASLLTEAHRLVDLTLRYIAAGGSAVLAFGLIQGRNFEFLRAGQDVSGWLIVLFISVVGIAIYAIHRAVLFRLVHFVLYTIVGRHLTPVRGPVELENETRIRRIDRRQRADPWDRIFNSWNAECHFLYCSSWGTFSAVALGSAIGLPWDRSTSICLAIGIGLLIAALVHDTAATLKELRH